jgi:hypothetical protein
MNRIGSACQVYNLLLEFILDALILDAFILDAFLIDALILGEVTSKFLNL